MKLVGLMLVRNEEWVLGCSVEAALKWCDEIVVVDHGSIDSTPDILADLAQDNPGRIHYYRFPVGGHWAEMALRQETLERGREVGGTHFAIVDADEVPTLSTVSHFLRIAIRGLALGGTLELPMISPWGSLNRYRVDDCVWTRAKITIAFADKPSLSWHQKRDGYDHHHRPPWGSSRAAPFCCDEGGIMHLQFADRRRLVAKHALYKAVEAVRWPGRRTSAQLNRIYGQALDEKGLRRKTVPTKWWEGLAKEKIQLGADPWQETALRELVAKHPQEVFRDLELWDLV